MEPTNDPYAEFQPHCRGIERKVAETKGQVPHSDQKSYRPQVHALLLPGRAWESWEELHWGAENGGYLVPLDEASRGRGWVDNTFLGSLQFLRLLGPSDLPQSLNDGEIRCLKKNHLWVKF